MEKEKFLECRNEIVAVLEKHGADMFESAKIVISALNEISMPDGFQVSLYVREQPCFPSPNLTYDQDHVEAFRRMMASAVGDLP